MEKHCLMCYNSFSDNVYHTVYTHFLQRHLYHGKGLIALCQRTYSTVKVQFSNKTPSCVHSTRHPCPGIWKSAIRGSLKSSLKILIRDGGTLTPCGTEKESPIAWNGHNIWAQDKEQLACSKTFNIWNRIAYTVSFLETTLISTMT